MAIPADNWMAKSELFTTLCCKPEIVRHGFWTCKVAKMFGPGFDAGYLGFPCFSSALEVCCLGING
jgi:hypothetical protein